MLPNIFTSLSSTRVDNGNCIVLNKRKRLTRETHVSTFGHNRGISAVFAPQDEAWHGAAQLFLRASVVNLFLVRGVRERAPKFKSWDT